MIVVDSSAIIAVLLGEPDGELLLGAMVDDGNPFMSVASVLECSIVLNARRSVDPGQLQDRLDAFLAQARMVIEPVGLEDLRLARIAHRQFGKGMGHPAQLNFGDCFSYALARRLDVKLLFKGDDFARTDIASAIAGEAAPPKR